jgi:hypothetical protein
MAPTGGKMDELIVWKGTHHVNEWIKLADRR